eukprot:gene31092-6221_t
MTSSSTASVKVLDVMTSESGSLEHVALEDRLSPEQAPMCPSQLRLSYLKGEFKDLQVEWEQLNAQREQQRPVSRVRSRRSSGAGQAPLLPPEQGGGLPRGGAAAGDKPTPSSRKVATKASSAKQPVGNSKAAGGAKGKGVAAVAGPRSASAPKQRTASRTRMSPWTPPVWNDDVTAIPAPFENLKDDSQSKPADSNSHGGASTREAGQPSTAGRQPSVMPGQQDRSRSASVPRSINAPPVREVKKEKEKMAVTAWGKAIPKHSARPPSPAKVGSGQGGPGRHPSPSNIPGRPRSGLVPSAPSNSKQPGGNSKIPLSDRGPGAVQQDIPVTVFAPKGAPPPQIPNLVIRSVQLSDIESAPPSTEEAMAHARQAAASGQLLSDPTRGGAASRDSTPSGRAGRKKWGRSPSASGTPSSETGPPGPRELRSPSPLNSRPCPRPPSAPTASSEDPGSQQGALSPKNSQPYPKPPSHPPTQQQPQSVRQTGGAAPRGAGHLSTSSLSQGETGADYGVEYLSTSTLDLGAGEGCGPRWEQWAQGAQPPHAPGTARESQQSAADSGVGTGQGLGFSMRSMGNKDDLNCSLKYEGEPALILPAPFISVLPNVAAAHTYTSGEHEQEPPDDDARLSTSEKKWMELDASDRPLSSMTPTGRVAVGQLGHEAKPDSGTSTSAQATSQAVVPKALSPPWAVDEPVAEVAESPNLAGRNVADSLARPRQAGHTDVQAVVVSGSNAGMPDKPERVESARRRARWNVPPSPDRARWGAKPLTSSDSGPPNCPAPWDPAQAPQQDPFEPFFQRATENRAERGLGGGLAPPPYAPDPIARRLSEAGVASRAPNESIQERGARRPSEAGLAPSAPNESVQEGGGGRQQNPLGRSSSFDHGPPKCRQQRKGALAQSEYWLGSQRSRRCSHCFHEAHLQPSAGNPLLDNSSTGDSGHQQSGLKARGQAKETGFEGLSLEACLASAPRKTNPYPPGPRKRDPPQ